MDQGCGEKLDELFEEAGILDFPDGYNEIPLAIAASELAVNLPDTRSMVAQGLSSLAIQLILQRFHGLREMNYLALSTWEATNLCEEADGNAGDL